jgi:Ca-activated chloride channel family protein
MERSGAKEEEEEEEAESPALDTHSGKLGVDLSVRLSELRNQSQLGRAKVRQAAGRTCVHLRGVWVDDGFDPKLTFVMVKALGAAYFRMLERQPQMREVFRLGNRVVWVTPSRTVLVIAPTDGKETMTDDEIDALFVAKK